MVCYYNYGGWRRQWAVWTCAGHSGKALVVKGLHRLSSSSNLWIALPPTWGQRPALDKNTLNGIVGVKSEMVRLETVGGSFGTFLRA